jgi:DNA-3-methyladenine glycosylase II
VTPRTFELDARGPYAFEASAAFLERFTPAAQEPSAERHTHWAFATDAGDGVAGVCLRPREGAVRVEAYGSDDLALPAQVARILSLDVDGTGFEAVGERDPVVGRLQARRPGLRPVLFFTPFEAAAWSVISHRSPARQAAARKAALSEALGQAVDVHGEPRIAFPPPRAILEAPLLPGLGEPKATRLRAIAEAAVRGELDPHALRALPPDGALAALKELPGIGDFFAQLILVRGVGTTDVLPVNEPRLLRAVGLAYGIDPPDAAGLEAIAEAWRPFRTWVAFLLRVSLAELAAEGQARARRA